MQVQSLGQEDPLEKEMATPVFLPGKFHGQKSLVGCSPWGCKELDMTERLNWTDTTERLNWTEWLSIHTHTHTHTHTHMHTHTHRCILDHPRWCSGKECAFQCRRHMFHPWVGNIPCSRKWQPNSSILAWKIAWTEDPGGLQSIGLQSRTRLSTQMRSAYWSSAGEKAPVTLRSRRWRSVFCACVLSHFSRVRLFVMLWTVAHLAALSMGFSRQETGMGCHLLLQGIFLTQGSKPGVPHCRQILYCLSH